MLWRDLAYYFASLIVIALTSVAYAWAFESEPSSMDSMVTLAAMLTVLNAIRRERPA